MKTLNTEVSDKTPEEQLGIAKIQIMFEDSFGMFNATSGHIKDVQKRKRETTGN
jgi:hypothetical protein